MATKVNYKTLPDMSQNNTVTTVKSLATEYAMDVLKVAQALKTAGIMPVGKIPVMKNGKPSVGKPTLAFDMKSASKVLTEAASAKDAA